MITFRRLRRPAALLLLVCMLSVVVQPVKTRALEPVTTAYVLTAAAMAASYGYIRYAPQINYHAMRFGGWASSRAAGIAAGLGTFAQAAGGKFVGFGRQIGIGANKMFGWMKKHPGDTAEIVGAGVELYQALKDNGSPNLAEVVRETFGPGTQVKTWDDQLETGNVVHVQNCGYVQIIEIRVTREWTSANYGDGYETCDRKVVNKVIDYDSYNNYNLYEYTIYTYKSIDPPEDELSKPLPSTLSPEQEERMINKIADLLSKNREAMEKELDELLKKNINDIDWPKFDPEAAKKKLYEEDIQALKNEINRVGNEIQTKQNSGQSGDADKSSCECKKCFDDCPTTCCESTCSESQLKDYLNELKRQLNEKEQEQTEKELDESFEPPEIPDIELKSIDFQPVIDLKDRTLGKFPFNLLRVVPAAFDVLTAEPRAPSFTADLGIGGQHEIDFAVFDGVASFIRLVLTWLIYMATVFCCFKIWSRF